MKIEINVIAKDEAVVSVDGQTAAVTIRRGGYDSQMDATNMPENSPGRVAAEQLHESVANILKILQISKGKNLWEPLDEESLDEIWEETL